MRNDIEYVQLFDLYKGLLTVTQREIFYSHYCLDLSFAEIAEENGISRQSAADTVKTVKEKLDEYENALSLKVRFDKLNSLDGLSESAKRAVKEITGR